MDQIPAVLVLEWICKQAAAPVTPLTSAIDIRVRFTGFQAAEAAFAQDG